MLSTPYSVVETLYFLWLLLFKWELFTRRYSHCYWKHNWWLLTYPYVKWQIRVFFLTLLWYMSLLPHISPPYHKHFFYVEESKLPLVDTGYSTMHIWRSTWAKGFTSELEHVCVISAMQEPSPLYARPFGACFPIPAPCRNFFSSTHKICSSHQMEAMLWELFEDQIEPHVPTSCIHC